MGNLSEWHVSTRDNRVSLHDCTISTVTFGRDITLFFIEGIYVLSQNSCNKAGHHERTGPAAVILRDGRYLNGYFEGIIKNQDGLEILSPVLQIMEKDIEKYEIVVLSYFLKKKKNIVELQGFSYEVEEGYPPYCSLFFSCSEIMYCWNEFVNNNI